MISESLPATPETPSPQRKRLSVSLGIATTLLTFITLVVACLWNFYPPLRSEQHLAVDLGTAAPGTRAPLVVTGGFESADFLYVIYVDANTVQIGYDRWGAGGPTSDPVTIQPGRNRLDLVLPSFASVVGTLRETPKRLQVALNGKALLDAPVEPFVRKRMRLWFGENPVGGSSCGPTFPGRLYDEKGNVMVGRVDKVLSWPQRFGGWLYFCTLQVVSILVLSVGAGWATARIVRDRGHAVRQALRSFAGVARRHRLFLATSAVCLSAFTWVVTFGDWNLLYEDSFGVFYDFQAQSLLQGRLDVPGQSLSGEAFVYQGKIYGYFGPTPALLRIPTEIFGVAMGKMTRPCMVLYQALALLATYLMLCHVVRLRSGPGARPSNWAIIVAIMAAGLGSTLFYLSSRAYVYHEAILCGASAALWCCYYTFRYIEAPSRRWWIGALICGTLSVHARPPVGFYALTFLGVAAAAHLVIAVGQRFRRDPSRQERPSWVKPLLIGAFSVLGVLSFNGLSYLKFGTIEGCPLRYNVQYHAQRLARIDGKQFHVQNIPYGVASYVVRPTIEVRREFPYFLIKGISPSEFPKAKIDMAESTAGLPWAMPGLSLLALISLATFFRPRGGLPLTVLSIWLAVIPAGVAMFAAIAVSHRYTGDFVPFLVSAAVAGIALLDSLPGIAARALRWLAMLVCILSFAITLALTLRTQGELVWGVPKETQERYQHWKARMNGWFLQP